MLIFSRRTGWDTQESAFAAAVRTARAQGRILADLTVSNPTACGFTYDTAAILAPLASPAALTYDPDPTGILPARQSVCVYYRDHGAVVEPHQLVLTTSTSEAYAFLFRLLANAGDEVLVPQPGYPLFDFLADLEDVHLRTYPLFQDFGWWIDFAELERRITDRTRAILVVHPANPTGHWTHRAERTQLEALCSRHGLALIVDEVFLDYPVAAAEPAVSFAHGEPGCLTFILSGLSKVAGLPQMKLGWIVTRGPHQQAAEALARLEVIADTFLSVSAPTQHALPAWLHGRHSIQQQIRARVRQNLDHLTASGAHFFPVHAGWSAIVRLPTPRGGADRLLEEHGIITHPGSFYSLPGTSTVVVSLLGDPADFTQGAAHLGA